MKPKKKNILEKMGVDMMKPVSKQEEIIKQKQAQQRKGGGLSNQVQQIQLILEPFPLQVKITMLRNMAAAIEADLIMLIIEDKMKAKYGLQEVGPSQNNGKV